VYRNTFANKPVIKVDTRKIIHAGDDLALVIVSWGAKAVTLTGENKSWRGTATDIVRLTEHGNWYWTTLTALNEAHPRHACCRSGRLPLRVINCGRVMSATSLLIRSKRTSVGSRQAPRGKLVPLSFVLSIA